MDSISDNTLNTQPAQWNGLTMDALRMRRAKMLVRREVKRATLIHQLETKRDEVSRNGVRSLLFTPSTVAGLKKADYAFLGYKAIMLLVRLYTRRKRR